VVDVKFELGEFLLEGPAFWEEVGWQFGFIYLDDVGSGFDFTEGMGGRGFLVGVDELVLELEEVMIIALLGGFLDWIWVFLLVH
jgi:hypothetical protein